MVNKEQQNQLYNFGKNIYETTIVKRHLQNSCHDLDRLDRHTPNNTFTPRVQISYFRCYGCNRRTRKPHPIYLFSCQSCGRIFQTHRHLSRDMTEHIFFVTGCRTKLGHQVALKLLRANAYVICTTRSPNNAKDLYMQYEDYQKWKGKLYIYPETFDLDRPNLEEHIDKIAQWIYKNFARLDGIIHCAAQTIRWREKMEHNDTLYIKNRYGDYCHTPSNVSNSWNAHIEDVSQKEFEEVHRVNAIAPAIIIQHFLPLLKRSPYSPYIINTHAKEGLFNVSKGAIHIHTNMAKASLSMLTRTLIEQRIRTYNGRLICIHGVDPGWISVDEYYKESTPFIVPPLDEVDGAARLLFPLWKQYPSCRPTRRHFCRFWY